jgi:hypothetical protein
MDPNDMIHSKNTHFHQSFNSFAILEAMFLNPIEVPEILLKRTPLSESLGNLLYNMHLEVFWYYVFGSKRIF